MAREGDFYGFSIETQNTQSLFRGFSVELDVNLIVTVLDSDGNAIDDTAIVTIYDASDDSELNQGNTEFGVFSDNYATPTALKIVAIHPIQGQQSTTLVHDGSSVYNVTISFVPTVFEFPDANPLRLYVTDGPQVDTVNKIIAEYTTQPRPNFDADLFYQPFLSGCKVPLQFKSSYTQHSAQIYTEAGAAVSGQSYDSLKVQDLTGAFDRYEFTFDLTGLDGRYYIEVIGSDDLQGSATARTQLIDVRASFVKRLVRVDYSDNAGDTVFDIYWHAGLQFTLYHEGEFWRSKYAGDKSIFVDDAYDQSVLSAVKRKHGLYKVAGVPDWLFNKINLAMDHEIVKVNGQQIRLDQDLEPVIEEGMSLLKGEAWLPFKEGFINRNT